ncbi:polysaccharide biosynthesis tyrosine autokinase [Enterobacter mori]|uniref:polysaccharide biosynthesis tyrosine autokinase n=1 Tax=Enterobacter mori TaxID=539813 RepID=UPI002B1F2DE7|nr:polysaccharide biosynthesis tyrosine autokinase [Enterobacter mori]MEA5206377.1 polysaccharide biosynthesis tyrosine autokinase [Enterobacter mori]
MSTNITPVQDTSVTSPELDLLRLLGELIDNRTIIVCVTALFMLTGTMYALFSTPVYIADAIVQIEQQKENSLLSSLKDMAPGGISPDSAPEMELLKSRMVLGQAVRKLNLRNQISEKHFPVVGKGWAKLLGETPGHLEVTEFDTPEQDGKRSRYQLIAGEKGHYVIEGEELTLEGQVGVPVQGHDFRIVVTKMDAKPGTLFTLQQSTELEAISNLSQRFTVAEKTKNSGILGMTLSGTDPVMIARTLRTITEIYLQQNIERQEAQDSKSLAFLEHQLPMVRQELEHAEERLNTYRKTRDSVDLNLEAKSVLEQIVSVDNQLNELKFREAEVSQLYKTTHPTYRALMEKRQTLEQEKTRLNKRVSGMPSTQQKILRLSRDVETGRTVYQQLLTRQQELNISKSSAIGNVRIIDDAVTLPAPIKPKKMLIVMMATMFGFVCAVGGVLLRAAIRKGIDNPELLEEHGINVYATLPRSEWLLNKTRSIRKKGIFSASIGSKTLNIPFLPVAKPIDLFVEAVRGLRTSLHFAMMDAENNVLMISGPAPECGKTLVSTSLATIVAQTGARVLYIDADMRRGYAHHLFHLSNDRGLSNVLVGKVAFGEAIQHFADGRFDVLTCGGVPPNPSELLMHERFRQLTEWANAHYEMVIVDTPPILAVTDALLVGRFCATTLLVARFSVTSTQEVLACTRRLQQSGVSLKGVILNDVIKRAATGYSAGHYHYSYSDEKPIN